MKCVNEKLGMSKVKENMAPCLTLGKHKAYWKACNDAYQENCFERERMKR